MAKRPVFTDVMDTLERRVASGEFMLKGLPGERKLAEDAGVSYMTARKAVLGLIDKEVLTRKPNGALEVHPAFKVSVGRCHVTLLTPAYPAAHLVQCRIAASKAARAHNMLLRPVEYMYWHDAVVREALDGSDGVIVIPSTEPIPDRLLVAMESDDVKVVFLDADMSHHGLPSIRLFAEEHIRYLLDHLRSLGHQRIDCFNVQGHNDEIDRRVDQWRAFIEDHGLRGQLFDNPAAPYEDPTARAHASMRWILDAHGGEVSAILCTTQPAAIGAIRTCADRGIPVGAGGISICTVNNEPTGRFLTPSLTGLEMPDIVPLLERCLDWFDGPARPWQGSLRITPDEPHLLEGESTAVPASMLSA